MVQPPTRKKVFIQNPNHQGVEIESLKQMYLGLLGRFVSVVMIEAPMGRLIWCDFLEPCFGEVMFFRSMSRKKRRIGRSPKPIKSYSDYDIWSIYRCWNTSLIQVILLINLTWASTPSYQPTDFFHQTNRINRFPVTKTVAKFVLAGDVSVETAVLPAHDHWPTVR